MATKKIKSDVSLEQNVSLPNKTASRALKIDSSGNLSESTVTETQLESLPSDVSNAQADATQALSDAAAAQSTADAAIPSAEKGAANGVATLDANSKIPSSQIPAIAITDVFTVADITARDALTVGSGDGEVQEGDVVIVTDASADSNITSGSASYIYNGSSYSLLKAGDEVLSVNGQTGVVVLDADDIDDSATTNKFTSQAEIDKLSGIEALADVTDATNVAAAGATMDSDTSLVGNGYFLDEDNMASDDATKVPSQQSVKAYVDNNSGNVSSGDIKEASFSFADNQASAVNVTGLAFANGVVRSFDAQVSVVRGSTYEVYRLVAIQKGASWDMSVEAVGDDTGVVFSINASGQVQYTSTSTGSGGTMKFRADTTSV